MLLAFSPGILWKLKQGHNNNSAGTYPRAAFFRQHIVAAERMKRRGRKHTALSFSPHNFAQSDKKDGTSTVYRVAIMCYNMDSRKGVS